MKNLIIIALLLPVLCQGQKDSGNIMPKWNVYVLAHTNPHYFELEVPSYVEKKISPVSFGGGALYKVTTISSKFNLNSGVEFLFGSESSGVKANSNNREYVKGTSKTISYKVDYNRYFSVGLFPELEFYILKNKRYKVSLILDVWVGIKNYIEYNSLKYENSSKTNEALYSKKFFDFKSVNTFNNNYFTFYPRVGINQSFGRNKKILNSIKISYGETTFKAPSGNPLSIYLMIGYGF